MSVAYKQRKRDRKATSRIKVAWQTLAGTCETIEEVLGPITLNRANRVLNGFRVLDEEEVTGNLLQAEEKDFINLAEGRITYESKKWQRKLQKISGRRREETTN